jgi:hypothetical protein
MFICDSDAGPGSALDAERVSRPTHKFAVARRIVKKQQMQWSKRGDRLLLKVRAAVLNGDLRECSRQAAEASPSIEDRVDV